MTKIKENRKFFLENFPEGSRVIFDRPPSTPEDPTIRTGKGTIVEIRDCRGGYETRVKYTLDDWQPGKIQECGIVTFLNDRPRRIDE